MLNGSNQKSNSGKAGEPYPNHHQPGTRLLSARQANQEFIARKQKWLGENQKALEYLDSRGITASIRSNFRLGLSELSSRSSKGEYGRSLLAPVIDDAGMTTKKSVYLNIPSVTVNPDDEIAWMRGEPLTYHSGAFTGQKIVLVCHTLPDLWMTWEALTNADKTADILLIASTHRFEVPREWLAPEFWRRFEKIYLAQENNPKGDRIAVRIFQCVAASAGTEIYRVHLPPHKGPDLSGFWRKGGKVSEFDSLLHQSARVGALQNDNSSAVEEAFGRFSYEPVDVLGEFHNGHLYYAVQAHVKKPEKDRDVFTGDMVETLCERKETIIIKSDRTTHSVFRAPAPKGTPREDRILKLTDGTVVDSEPHAGKLCSWSWNSIEAYCLRRNRKRALGDILSEIRAYLKQSVWLPFEEDYDLLTLLVPVTYSQAIFESVPLVLVTGPPASGKSALGRAMAKVCANATVIGQVSAASIARLINQTRGFVVLDDLESIGRSQSRLGKGSSRATAAVGASFGDLVQALKLSYNKETSSKVLTDMSQPGRFEYLNFFGVKMINNTRGTDDILGSRMLRIETGLIPEEIESVLEYEKISGNRRLQALRDDLHTWTFENAVLIDQTYRRLLPSVTDRFAEISAPLRVFAEISGDETLSMGLEFALKAKSRFSPEALVDPVAILKEAARRLVREGFREISASHLVLEMKSVHRLNGSPAFGSDSNLWEDPAWVGRLLRENEIVERSAITVRHRWYGKSLRIYPLSAQFVAEVLSEFNESAQRMVLKDPFGFCRECSGCGYQEVGCPFIQQRMKFSKNC